MMQVRWAEYWTASDRWNSVTEVPFDNDKSFHKFLGCNSIAAIDDAATERIKLLNGPHYRTIIKAYLARTNQV